MVWFCLVALCLLWTSCYYICTMIKSEFYKLLGQLILSTCKYWFSFCPIGNETLESFISEFKSCIFHIQTLPPWTPDNLLVIFLFASGMDSKSPISWDVTGMSHMEGNVSTVPCPWWIVSLSCYYRCHSFLAFYLET